MNDYFCSQLVAVILNRAQLIQQPPGLVTPCALYDELVEAGWNDVTTIVYGSSTIAEWKRRSLEDWRLFFQEDVGFAKWFRDAAVSGPMIDLEGEMLSRFSDSLEVTRRDLEARYHPDNSE